MTHRLFFLCLVLLTSACASSAPSSETESMSDMERLFWQRQQEAMSRYTQAEVDFMTGMIGHHAQALIMADLAVANEASSPIRILTSRIINAQNDEIATMQKWLKDRGEPVPEVHIDGLQLMIHMPGEAMGGDGQGHSHMMAGMLTQAQLEELAAAKGPDFDRLFLTYMIQHHKGAVTMVDDMFSTDGAGNDEAAFKLASDIQADQSTEIARMELMLESMTGSGN
ncbi:MAG: DUF305 domain-containing protein [Bacteroidetes bacterium]|nr:DUF305 domain-containing protein [Bacteroidota bacterium]MDA0873636.1 DUF305 domain-containing protein [Bacteroidota bacterium]